MLRAILKMKSPGDRRPDFERFRRAVTSNEPGPVPVGEAEGRTQEKIDATCNFAGRNSFRLSGPKPVAVHSVRRGERAESSVALIRWYREE